MSHPRATRLGIMVAMGEVAMTEPAVEVDCPVVRGHRGGASRGASVILGPRMADVVTLEGSVRIARGRR